MNTLDLLLELNLLNEKSVNNPVNDTDNKSEQPNNR